MTKTFTAQPVTMKHLEGETITEILLKRESITFIISPTKCYTILSNPKLKDSLIKVDGNIYVLLESAILQADVGCYFIEEGIYYIVLQTAKGWVEIIFPSEFSEIQVLERITSA